MSQANIEDEELIRFVDDVPKLLTSIANFISRKTTFFVVGDGEWEKVLLGIFKSEASKDKKRRAKKRRQEIKKKMEDLHKVYEKLKYELDEIAFEFGESVQEISDASDDDNETEQLVAIKEQLIAKSYHQSAESLTESEKGDKIEQSVDKSDQPCDRSKPSDDKIIELGNDGEQLAAEKQVLPAEVIIVAEQRKKPNPYIVVPNITEPLKKLTDLHIQIPIKVESRSKRKYSVSAYQIWLEEHREQIKKDNPTFTSLEVNSRALQIWRSLKDTSEWEQKFAQEGSAKKIKKISKVK